MLGTWADIQRSLGRYPVQSPNGDDLATFGFPEAGQATAIFQVKFAQILGRQRIFIGTNVAIDAPAIAHEAMVVNSELLVGSLMVFKGNIVLKHGMTVGRFDDEELHEVIANMARSAGQAAERLNKLLPHPNHLYTAD